MQHRAALRTLVNSFLTCCVLGWSQAGGLLGPIGLPSGLHLPSTRLMLLLTSQFLQSPSFTARGSGKCIVSFSLHDNRINDILLLPHFQDGETEAHREAVLLAYGQVAGNRQSWNLSPDESEAKSVFFRS